jgi:FtsZ-binding cell division protein ZapB
MEDSLEEAREKIHILECAASLHNDYVAELVDEIKLRDKEIERLRVANNVIGRSAAKQAMEIGRLSHENEQLRTHPTCETCGAVNICKRRLSWRERQETYNADYALGYCSAHTALSNDKKES